MSLRALALALVVACLLTLVSGRARAQSDAAARAHYERGVALFDEGQFTAALAEFEAAYEASHRAPILFNIGQIQARLGRAVESADTLRRYLAEGGDSITSERRALVQREIETQTARIASLTATVSVPGAIVSLDDVEVGTAPLPSALRVSAGEHVIAARAEGFETARFRFRIAGGESQSVALELVARAEGAARLRITVNVPGAEIRVDGRSIGLTPIELPVGLPAGPHRIEVSRPGYEPLDRTAVVPPSGEETLSLELVRQPSPPPGVLTRVALALPTTSHTVRIDGQDVPAGVAALELPNGLHDLSITAADMEPVTRRVDIPAGPSFVLDPGYRWSASGRESRRSAAESQRVAGLAIVGGGLALAAAGGGMLIARHLSAESNRYWDRSSTAQVCRAVTALDLVGSTLSPPFRPTTDCQGVIDGSGFLELVDFFEDRTNELAAQIEGLAVGGGIAIGLGAVGAVAGIIVLATAPSDGQIDSSTTIPATVTLDVGPGGLSLRGTF